MIGKIDCHSLLSTEARNFRVHGVSLWLQDIKTALGNLGGVGHYKDIYSEIARIHVGPLTREWQAGVRRVIQEHAAESQGFKGTALFYSVDGLGAGVWGLKEFLKPSLLAADVGDPEAPERIQQQVYRILRDTEMTRKLKALYRNECQLCGCKLSLADGSFYSEAHHVQPLGRPHSGPDIASNILVLCPNHHVLLDYGAMKLDIDKLRTTSGHSVDPRYVDYHNAVICQSGDFL